MLEYQQLYQCLCNSLIDSVFVDGAYQIGPNLWAGYEGIKDFHKALTMDLDEKYVNDYIKNLRIIKRRSII